MPDLRVVRDWDSGRGLFEAARSLFEFGPGDDRATGQLYAEGEQGWPDRFAERGPRLLVDLDALLGVRFTIVIFQAYRNGSGCDWHADTPFDAQAILSLGITRTFGILSNTGGNWYSLHHGDLVFMPSGFQSQWKHCVPVEHVPGERVSLVFRTVAKG
jgi:alkylated DNA repair dioxygenase AlkB